MKRSVRRLSDLGRLRLIYHWRGSAIDGVRCVLGAVHVQPARWGQRALPSEPKCDSLFQVRLTLRVAIAALALGALAGCDNMKKQPNFRAMTPNPHFANGTTARSAPANTVVHGSSDSPITAATLDKLESLTTPPMPVTRELLEHGKERFTIYCAVCHGPDGYGKGIVVRRGFPSPPSFHDERLRQAPVGHFFAVATRGFGVMYSYADRVPEADRWAIAAYIQALQRSQNTAVASLSEEQRRKLPSP